MKKSKTKNWKLTVFAKTLQKLIDACKLIKMKKLSGSKVEEIRSINQVFEEKICIYEVKRE